MLIIELVCVSLVLVLGFSVGYIYEVRNVSCSYVDEILNCNRCLIPYLKVLLERILSDQHLELFNVFIL